MGESHTDDRIRLALVITELEVGGAERCLVHLATGLDRKRFAPVVYSIAPCPTGQKALLVEQLEAAQVPAHFLGITSKWRVFGAVRSLAQRLREQAPDIVQTFLFHANVVGTLAARRSGIRNIVTGIRVADPRRWRQRLEGYVARRVSKVVCVSKSVASFARSQMGYSAEQLIVIPNGIDVAGYPAEKPFDLRQFGIPGGRRAIVFVGRLDSQKGVDWLLQVAPRIFKQHPQHDLLLVGDGPLRTELEAQAASRQISERVHFAGWRSDVREILKASDLLVLPSRWEGMPNVLLEAMASGLPVLSSQVEGVLEVLGPLADDQTFPPLGEREFLERISNLLGRFEHSKSLAEKNRVRVENCFSRQAMLIAYERLYESLVH